MPTASVPKYAKHKHSGQAVVHIGGKSFYLGKFRSKDSKAKYATILARWSAGDPIVPQVSQSETVGELLLEYVRWAKTYYRKNGKTTSQVTLIKSTGRELRKLFGELPVVAFGSPQLALFRDHLVIAPSQGQKSEPLARTEINRRVRIVRQMFRWGLEKKKTTQTQVAELENVTALFEGRTKARESERRRPVSVEVVNQTLPHLPPILADVVRLQLATAARPSEVLCIRWMDVDTSADVWMFRPLDHKNSHLSKDRVIAIGPQGQAVLSKYSDVDPEAFIFSPSRSEEQRRIAKSSKRKTPPHHGNSVGTNRVKKPRCKPGACYTAASYRRAVERACSVAKVPKWSPYALRHSQATAICNQFGLEVASRVLGHASTTVTRRVYTATATGPAADAARALG
jgi:integrase